MNNPAVSAVAQDFALLEDRARAALLGFNNANTAHLAAASNALIIDGAVELLRETADSQRDAVRKNVEAVVSAALRAVFGDNLALVLDVGIKRGVVSMEPMLVYRSPARRVPLSEVGGGVADVVAFAFRVAVLCLRRPRLRPVLIADEPFKHVSAAYLPNIAAMLRELVDRTGLQFIIVSHEPEIAACADKLFRVSMVNGESIVR